MRGVLRDKKIKDSCWKLRSLEVWKLNQMRHSGSQKNSIATNLKCTVPRLFGAMNFSTSKLPNFQTFL
jgi:hypothetical protein